MFNKDNFDKTNAVVALLVTITAFVVYNLTKAPTLSFWDCGEFIAASVTLGIPHPPGTPFYILMGRIFSILPISPDIGVRINLLSVVSSTFAVTFGYLILSRILKSCLPDIKSFVTKVLIYGGSACGALLMAFGKTNWNNSVETEVYGLAMMISLAIIWLALVYHDNKGTNLAAKLMAMVFFFAYLGIGVHMTTFLVVPVLALFFIIKKESPSSVWFAFAVFIVFELFLIFSFSSKPGEIPFYIPALIVFIFFIFFIFSFEKIPKVSLAALVIMLLTLMPLLGLFLKSINPTVDYTSLINSFNIIGWVGMTASLLGGLYFLVTYYKNKKINQENRFYQYLAYFLLAPAIALIFLNLFHGYDAYLPFLIITLIIAIVILTIYREHINWLVLIAIGAVSLVMIGVKPFFLASLVALVLIPVIGKIRKLPGWRNAVLIIIVSIMGYSTHLFIPIRSSENPKINENNPASSLTATIDFIERKQYGSMSMTKRMFQRRAEWNNQFGNFRRMGYWSFFSEQYGVNGKWFVLLFVLGLFGIWETIRRKPKLGLPFFLLVLLASIGLILYMNFADGTRMIGGRDYLEVRDRDYFYTPAFMLFGLALGLGLTFIIQFVREAVQAIGKKISNSVAMVSSLIFFLPIAALTGNYHEVDRSGNFIPYDYAYNLLISADPNAIFFTAGDNDTFPLWCLQDAYKVRPDVSLVNLSLAQTKWYIKQLPTNLKVETGWSEAEVDQLRPFQDQNGIVHVLNDQVVTQIIKKNIGKRPINFSVTVPSRNRKFLGRSIDSLLELNGLSWRLTKNKSGMRRNLDATIDLYFNHFKYRGINDESVYKDEATLRLISNMPRSIIQVADSLRKLGEVDTVKTLLKRTIELIPQSTDAINYLANLYEANGMDSDLKELIENTKYGNKNSLFKALGQLYLRKGDTLNAIQIYQGILIADNNNQFAFENLIRLYYYQKDHLKVRELAVSWIENNPDDEKVIQILEGVNQLLDQRREEGTNN